MNTIEYNGEYFAGAMQYWHKISFPEFSSFFLDNVPESLESVLDLGCGDGFYGELLKKKASRLVGCDSSETVRSSSLGNRYYDKFIFIDIEDTIPGDVAEKFDLIFSSEVIEHLKDYKKLIRLAYQLLNRGGKLILSTTTYYLYLPYYLVYADPLKPGALTEFAAGLSNERAASNFVRYLWALTGGHHHGFVRKRLLKSIKDEGFLINAVRYANVQPVFPVENLGNRNRALRVLLKGIGKAANSFCRKSGIYGANILVSANKG